MNIPFIQAATTTWEQKRFGTKDVPHDGSIRNIIIHTVVGSLQSAVNTFQSGSRGVSAHYIVGTDGQVVQTVKEEDTAYHAGNYKMNLMSVGIEHADNAAPYDARPDILYRKSGILVAYLCGKYALKIDRATIRLHKEVSNLSTACPATLDIDKIIQYALRAYNGENLLDTQPAAPSGADYHRTVVIVLEQGVNVRSTPALAGSILTALPLNTKVMVEKVVQGENVTGNNLWYKLKDQDRYIWTGGTNVPNPVLTTANVEDTPPAVDMTPSDTLSIAELQTRYDKQQDTILLLTKENQELKKKTETLKTDLEVQEKKVTAYETETRNYEIIKNANESLSTQVTQYQNKLDELKRKLSISYVEAFKGWNLIEVPHGVMAIAKIPMIAFQLYTLIVSVVKHDYVVGWKKDARLYNAEDYRKLYGEYPESA